MKTKRTIRALLIVGLLLATGWLSRPAPVQANGDQELGDFMRVKLYGDVVAAGVGLRGTGVGNITLTRIPANASVYRAFLYWATLGSLGTYTQPALNGQAVQGRLIGSSADTCWGAAHNFVYRAEVTSQVTGNGVYALSGLPNNLAAGNDSQGASLVVLYTAPDIYRTIVIDDGAVTLDLATHAYTDALTGFTADQPNARAHVTYLVGDGQSQWNSGSVSFEGNNIANNVFNGADGDYWGTLTFNVTGLVTEPTAPTTINNNQPPQPGSPDCLVWAGTIFSVDTESPTSAAMIFIPLILP